MEYKNYITNIQYYFNYLIEEYGFTITKIVDKSDQMLIKVEYSSKSTIFIITIGRYEISTIFRPIDKPEIASLSLYLIFEYFSKINNQSLYVTPDINKIEITLELLSKTMEKYCKPFIIGDYSQWNNLLLWFHNKTRKEYHDITGRILPDSELTEYLRANKTLK